jgi:hypothetical protein
MHARWLPALLPGPATPAYPATPLEELIEPKPAVLSSALKRKSKPPRIYNLGGRPALSAAT